MASRKTETSSKNIMTILLALQEQLTLAHAKMINLHRKKVASAASTPSARKLSHGKAKRPLFQSVDPPPTSEHVVRILPLLEDVEPPEMYLSKDGSTFKDRMAIGEAMREERSVRAEKACRAGEERSDDAIDSTAVSNLSTLSLVAVVGRLDMRLHNCASRLFEKKKVGRLQSGREEFFKDAKREKILKCFAKFSHEANALEEALMGTMNQLRKKALSATGKLTASEKKLYESIVSRERSGPSLALKYVTEPPCPGSLTCTPEGYRAALSLVMPSLNQLLSKEDAFVLHKLTAGNAILLSELLLVGDEIYLASKLNPGQMKRIVCWGGGRKDVGLMKLRSAGFETRLKFDEIPSKVSYGYSKSILAPPENWNTKEIVRR